MRFNLKSNWSEQFIYDDKKPGYFSGRKKELQSLQSILKNNSSSSILVSSVRGFGKSSFVHKALSSIKNSYKKDKTFKKKLIPIFLNLGNIADYNGKNELQNRYLIKALIRSAYMSEDIKREEPSINKLYKNSLGYFSLFSEKKDIDVSTVQIQTESYINSKLIIYLASALLLLVGLTINDPLLRTIVSGSSFLPLSISFIWKKFNQNSSEEKETQKIDNDFEYLEAKFEEILKTMHDKGYLLVFVIDELDKVDASNALLTIKSLKNMFSRSFAHFIFITEKEAYILTEKNREDKDHGTYPTLFTHKIYLPLPSTTDLELYLNEIFSQNEVDDSQDFKNLRNYLLFKSKNDFFCLKNLLFDLCEYDDTGQPFIDSDRIKSEDPSFDEINNLYHYVADYIIKSSKTLKYYWTENSIKQEEALNFLNNFLNKNFSNDNLSENLNDLINLLLRGKIIEQNSEENNIKTYGWTHSCILTTADSLYEEEMIFQNKYKQLVRTGNILQNLSLGLPRKNWKQKENLEDGEDGSKITGIYLSTIYKKYFELNKDLRNAITRKNVKREQSDDAIAEINTTLENIQNNFFTIFLNLLDQRIELGDIITLNKQDGILDNNFNIQNILSTLPNFLENMQTLQSRVYVTQDGSKYIFLVKDFSDIQSVKDSLKILVNNKNVLFINMSLSDTSTFKSLKYKDLVTYKNGKSREIDKIVPNFKNFNMKNFEDFEKVIKLIKTFLS